MDDKKLAGTAVFPKAEYKAWQKIQSDTNLSEEIKVKNTIDTYFKLKYENWISGNLLDFVFLFNTESKEAFEDYAYERGLHYLRIEGQKYRGTLLESYDYKPVYYSISIEGDEARVDMWPRARIVHSDTPIRTDPTPYTSHQFELLKRAECWLIGKVTTDDEMHHGHKRGTDFNEFAKTYAERVRRLTEDRGTNNILKLRYDSFYKALWERLQQQANEQGLNALNKYTLRDLYYSEISGDYIFEIDDNSVFISFKVRDNVLFALKEGDFYKPMAQESENPHKFNIRWPSREIYTLQFQWNDQGEIDRCKLSMKNTEYWGTKVIE